MNFFNDSLKAFLPQILDQAKTGIAISDAKKPDNPLVYVNSIFTEIFEYLPSEVIGKNCRFLQGDDREQPELELIRDAVKNKTHVTVTLRNYSKSGKLVYNEISVSPIFDENNEIVYFLGVQKDVTEQKMLEAENEKLRELEVREKINKATEDAMCIVIDEMDLPVAVSENGKLTYVNKSMSKLLAFSGIGPFGIEIGLLDKMIVQRPEHIVSISEIQVNGEAKKIALKDRDEVKYFLAKKNTLVDMPHNSQIELFVMYDITEITKQKLTIGYQKNKLKSYSEVLEEILLAKVIKKASSNKQDQNIPHDKAAIQIESLINEEDLEILRKSRSTKVSAAEFFAELDEYTIAEMDIIGQLESELVANVDRFASAVNKKNLSDVSMSFGEYGNYIKSYLGFEDLSYALLSLASFLDKMDEETIQQNHKKLFTYVESICTDLRSWSENILIKKEALDIHYLDSSLLSSCLQLQLQIGIEGGLDAENEMELF